VSLSRERWWSTNRHVVARVGPSSRSRKNAGSFTKRAWKRSSVAHEIWRSRTDEEHAALQRLARSDEPGELDPAAIPLVREGYLARTGDKVAFVVPLFREWIRMNFV
jgi:hypothetical protein